MKVPHSIYPRLHELNSRRIVADRLDNHRHCVSRKHVQETVHRPDPFVSISLLVRLPCSKRHRGRKYAVGNPNAKRLPFGFALAAALASKASFPPYAAASLYDTGVFPAWR